MKNAIVRLIIAAFFLIVLLPAFGCGDTETNELTPATPTLPPAPTDTGPSPGIPGDSWDPDGILNTDEYLGEMQFVDFEVRWTLDDRFVYFGIKAKTAGWVSIGLNPSSRMKDADMIFGMVKDGQPVISDQFSTGTYGPHSPDTELGGTEDIADFGGREDAGFTTIEFSRALDTGDEYDSRLTTGTVEIIWAFGTSDDFGRQHSRRGNGLIELQALP